ncbi:MAG: hypothetical protein LRY28_01200 [Erysipelotrichaceae bacterium]|nr:hypothetical protein [Erysipelotrichaceae bacterium]
MNGVAIMIGLVFIFYVNRQLSIKVLFKKSSPIYSIYGPAVGFFHRKEAWIKMMFLLIMMMIVGVVFKLSIDYVWIMFLLCSVSLPLLLYYQSQANHHAHEFNQVTTFLQHFLAHFKIHQQAYHALKDVSHVVDESRSQLIHTAIETLERDATVHPLYFMTQWCPHFIVINIMSWIQHVESHGFEHNHEILDMLENDIDDWIEDSTLYMKNMHSIKNKILILCGLSLLISLFNQHMLGSFMDLASNQVYQFATFTFLTVVLFTGIKAFKLMDCSWILKSELLWKE